jgi:hypothetical protein
MPKKTKRRARGGRRITARSLRFVSSSGSVTLSAASAGTDAAGSAEAPLARFQMRAYTGGPMRVGGWAEPIVIDLRGLSVGNKSRPILRDHDPRQVVGHSEDIRVHAGALLIDGVISGAGDAASEVVESSRNGFPWQASVGVDVQVVEDVPAGQSVRVNGREFAGPLAVVRRGALSESSFVALGADDDTAALAATRSGESTMTFAEWLTEQGFKESELTDAQRATLMRQFQAEQDQDDDQDGDQDGDQGGDQDGDQDDDQDGNASASRSGRRGLTRSQRTRRSRSRANATLAELREREVEETARVAAIRRLCRTHPAIEATAIADGWSVDRAELEILRAARPNVPGVRGSSADVTSPAIEIAIARSCGVSSRTLEARYRSADLEAADRASLRRIGLSGLFMEAARLAGNPVGIGGLQDEHIQSALSASRFVSASGSSSTVSVPTILSNVASLVMLDGYRSVPDVTPAIARSRSVDDFKQVKSVRLVTKSAFEKVGSDGELKHATLGEQAYANQAETFGTILTLTRKMIIDDSLDVFMNVPRELGQLAMSRKNETAIQTLLAAPTGSDDTDFFQDDINWFEGADTSLGIDSLTVAERAFFERIGPNGKPVLMKPSILLVAPKNKTRADNIYKSEKIASVELVNTPENNPHAGSFRPEMSPWLAEVAGLVGANNEAWWLLSDPMSNAAMEICYLRGQSEPVIRSRETPVGTLGLSFEAVFDFGVALQDKMAIVGMKGKE